MTHNLVIANDNDSEFVKFDVLIPDGYNSFKIDYLNGSIINQNYLKVGDKLKFEFSNNPIKYNVKLQPRLVNADDHQTINADTNEYKSVSFDVFKLFKIVYIPIYTYYMNDGHFIYVFNPCDNNELYDEPKKITEIPAIQISNFIGTIYEQTYATFTGTFLIGFQPVDNIPAITVEIGESISNSKTKPQDVGTYAIQAEAINDVRGQSIQSTAYNYGNTWNYPINNLIINHHESFLYNLTNNSSSNFESALIFGVMGQNDGLQTITTTTLPISQVNVIHGKINNEMLFMAFSQSTPGYFSTIETDFILPPDELQGLILHIIKVDDDDNSKYHTIQYESVEEAESAVAVITGSTLNDSSSTNKYRYLNEQNLSSHNQFRALHYIKNDWLYSTNIIQILVGVRRNDTPSAPFDFSGQLELGKWVLYSDDQSFNPYSTSTKITFDNTIYHFVFEEDLEVENPPIYDFIFKLFDINKQEFIFSPDNYFYLVGALDAMEKTTPNDHKFVIVKSLNTGFIKSQKYNKIDNKLFNTFYQLTATDTEDASQRTMNHEDLYCSTNTAADELKFSIHHTSNTVHYIHYTNGQNEPTLTNIPFKWYNSTFGTDDSRNKELKCFIPLKTNRPLTRFHPNINDINNNWQTGFFYVKDLNGFDVNELIDNQCEVFLAGGHESLNVESAQKDDKRYKTFNGSLMFDRSDSRITRIFSNDITGSALGYLNDILSAKLARYYFISNLNIFNSFLPTGNKIIVNNNSKGLNANYSAFNYFYSGDHSTTIASCFDLVKLIGSENIVNNCSPSLQVEQQQIPTNVWHFSQLISDSTTTRNKLLNQQLEPFYYKFFHYYNSGLNEYPYNGFGVNDNPDGETTIGGLNVLRISNLLLTCPEGYDYKNKVSLNASKPYFVMSGSTAYYNNNLKNSVSNYSNYNTNRNNKTCGIIETLPCYRIYKNLNFEQTDLTITTGGIKTLHPIYLQSTPRILINNILYMTDFIINYVSNVDNYGFVHVLTFSNDYIHNLHLIPNVEYPILRFGKVVKPIYNRKYAAIAQSFDSLYLLNYMNNDSINEYENIADILDSLPNPDTEASNEEIIYNFSTDSPLTNIQLFSKRRFDFYSGIDELAMVCAKSQYIEQVIWNDSILDEYYNINTVSENGQITINNELLALIQNTVNGFINNISSFNNLKNVKMLIVKLGEFLQFPKILYGSSNSFNNSLNVSIDNLNMAKYKSALKTTFKYSIDTYTQQQISTTESEFNDSLDNQKINVYLYGVMFKYHQLALGYQNLNNEMSNEYTISKALGNRHFELVLSDEYGRLIPNVDTSQGFKNNLYLEITLV